MSNNIYTALEQLGLGVQKRTIHVLFSNSSLNDQVFLQRIDGTHTLNLGLSRTKNQIQAVFIPLVRKKPIYLNNLALCIFLKLYVTIIVNF